MTHYKMSDVAVEVNDRENNPASSKYDRFVGLEHYVSGEVIIRNYGSTENLESTMKIFQSGDVLVARRNVYLKRASMVDFDGLTSGDSIVLRAKNPVIGRILPFVLNTDAFWDFADQYSDGTMSKRLSPKTLMTYEFDLPDEDELEKFADLLWAANDTRESYQALLRQTDELVKSQFIELFGDPIKNEFNWPQQRLQDLVSADCSISYGIVKTGDDVPGGIPVFRPVDIVGKNPTIADLKRTTAEISAQYKRTLLKGRELLITVRANIGDTCIIGDEFAGCNVGRGIVPIRLNEDIMSLEFLKGQMDFESMSQHIKSLAKGVTLIQLNMEDLRMIKLIVPPVDLQNKYVSLLQQTDKSKFVAYQETSFIEKILKYTYNHTFRRKNNVH